MDHAAETAREVARRLEESVGRVLRGKLGEVRRALVALLSRGHLLIEDVPGTGKTVLAKSIAKSIDATFRRVQLTPDLLPGDLTGVSVFHPRDLTFQFRRGPIFTSILLADELNRATPRTQAALLEAMEERQVTADGETHRLEEPFFVLATQNPIEQHGTFPLPEAELDRFLFRLSLGYPSPEIEAELLAREGLAHPVEGLAPVTSAAEVRAAQVSASHVHVDASVRRYVVALVERTRRHKESLLGGSPRASIGLCRAAQALALIEGERFVRPEHVQTLAHPVLDHRIIVRPQARVSGLRAADIVAEALRQVDVPVGSP